MENIERAANTSKSSPAHRFLKRIKDAEQRGMRVQGSITEAQLIEFETRGKQPSKPASLKSTMLTSEERERIRLMKLREIEEAQTQARLDLARKELKQAQKFEHLHIIQGDKPATIIYLR